MSGIGRCLIWRYDDNDMNKGEVTNEDVQEEVNKSPKMGGFPVESLKKVVWLVVLEWIVSLFNGCFDMVVVPVD